MRTRVHIAGTALLAAITFMALAGPALASGPSQPGNVETAILQQSFTQEPTAPTPSQDQGDPEKDKDDSITDNDNGKGNDDKDKDKDNKDKDKKDKDASHDEGPGQESDAETSDDPTKDDDPVDQAATQDDQNTDTKDKDDNGNDNDNGKGNDDKNASNDDASLDDGADNSPTKKQAADVVDTIHSESPGKTISPPEVVAPTPDPPEADQPAAPIVPQPAEPVAVNPVAPQPTEPVEEVSTAAPLENEDTVVRSELPPTPTSEPKPQKTVLSEMPKSPSLMLPYGFALPANAKDISSPRQAPEMSWLHQAGSTAAAAARALAIPTASLAGVAALGWAFKPVALRIFIR